MSREEAEKRLQQLRQARDELLAQLNAVQGVITEYEKVILPALQTNEVKE